jgi:uncharacterized membrane protein
MHAGGWVAVMWVAVIVFWTAVAAGIWAYLAAIGHGGERSAEDILMRRYADGEINNEEYRARLTELRHS